MPRKSKDGGINKSARLRELLRENPKISFNDASTRLEGEGIDIKSSLFYFVKGKVVGRRGRRRKMRRDVATVLGANGAATASAGAGDALATIKKIKGLAAEVGGLKKLRALVEVLSE